MSLNKRSLLPIVSLGREAMASSRSRSPSRSRSGGADRFPEAKAAGVVLWTEEGTILIGYQPQKKGKWSEPGGKRPRGESVVTCAKRELREETGLGTENTEGLTMQWGKPTYIPDCKHIFFQEQIGDGRPATSTTFSEYKFVRVGDIPAANSFRLQRVAHFLRREGGDEARRRDDASGFEALEQMLLRGAQQ